MSFPGGSDAAAAAPLEFTVIAPASGGTWTFSGGFGLEIDLAAMPVEGDVSMTARAFAEDPSRYLLEVDESDLTALSGVLGDLPHATIGTFREGGSIRLAAGGLGTGESPANRFLTAWNEGCAR